ncbi:hypothetical protein TWF225_009864 [Orbilia oligospora]|nr:hypothetical protein TWF225_009864 [Orbilia oligospora]KAF3173084.1 hypothetical protein TWF225_009864 [Orbilia oligospora]KAF3266343.1 hypothetical protein TWF128_010759 [Orbilia oligospora]KAF3266344.1 hypothetical protein TWF128_010759 [Orbilia oligospora]KAF3269289.1 hypothetical protein TWF217_009379 [Orbilia oligospora]
MSQRYLHTQPINFRYITSADMILGFLKKWFPDEYKYFTISEPEDHGAGKWILTGPWILSKVRFSFSFF